MPAEIAHDISIVAAAIVVAVVLIVATSVRLIIGYLHGVVHPAAPPRPLIARAGLLT
jgi:hypothetical protein